ncbi:MAG: FecR domain-containing protein [Cytophagales bacterium]|nr:FecR domain-containing protein [Cytophagales bacterium]
MKQEDFKLLKKYLEGNTSPEENLIVRDLLVQNDEDDALKQWLFKEWQKTPAKKELPLDINAAWPEVEKALSGNSKPSEIRWQKIAAAVSVVLAVILGTLFFQRWSDGNSNEPMIAETEYIQKQTAKGEKLNISLPDGSFIKLNASTKLSIPANYHTNSERVVYLQGEAFFEVAKFEKRLFKVITGEVTTTVMGTSFNVKAQLGEDRVSVALVEGKVKVANVRDEIMLDSAEMTTVQSSVEKLSKRDFNIETITGWRDNLLIFDEIPFREIIAKLEQWYGVEFEISGAPLADRKYSGRFENKSLALVLEGLGFSSAFDYEIKNKSVFLNFKK